MEEVGFQKDFSLLRVSGADARRYLQGRVSCDVASSSSSTPALILTPQGKLEGFFSLKEKGAGFEIVLLGGDPKEFTDSLLRFKVADDVEVELVAQGLGIQISDQAFSDTEDSFSWPSIYRESWARITSDKDSSENYSSFCSYLGLPRFGVDVNSGQIASVLPLEKVVSFTKGCYAGQEVVEKSQAYGRVNKKLVAFSTEKPCQAGREMDNKAGVITSAEFFETEKKHFGIALVSAKALENPLTLDSTPLTVL